MTASAPLVGSAPEGQGNEAPFPRYWQAREHMSYVDNRDKEKGGFKKFIGCLLEGSGAAVPSQRKFKVQGPREAPWKWWVASFYCVDFWLMLAALGAGDWRPGSPPLLPLPSATSNTRLMATGLLALALEHVNNSR